MRRAPVTNATLSMDGGAERVQYYLSGSIFDQTGVILASGYRRAAGRMNLDFNATNKLRVSSSLGVSREAHKRIENDNTIEGIGANAIALAPSAPVRRGDGSYTAFDALEYINPMAIADHNSIETRTIRTFGNVEANYNLTTEFTVTGRFGVDLMNLRDLRWDSPNVEDSYAFTANGVSTQAQTNANRYLSELWGTYNLRAFENQTAALTVGTSLEWNGAEDDYIRGEGFASEGFRYPGAATKVTSYDGGWTGHNLASFFGRANYSFLDRYQLMASLRADGSSRFGEENKWGVFPAASFGWTISDEPAIQPMLGNTGLKLRFSYGTTGNQALTEDFAPLERYARANYAEEIGLAQVSISNPALKWETTREMDAGFDLALFNSRVSIIGDYYQKLTTDLLVDKPISATTGQTSRLENVGSMKNAGVEFEVSTRNFVAANTGGFEWTTDFNIAANRNRVISLYNDEPFSSGRYDINRVEVGHQLGEFYAFRFAGVDPATGNAQYYNAAGQKVLYTALSANDQTFVGSPHPKYTGGFTNTMSWGGLELRGFVQFSQGSKIFNAIRVFADDGGRYADNKFANVLSRWQKPGDITDQPRASVRGNSGALVISDRLIEDGSYVRLGEITLGYNLPARFGSAINLQNSRIYVSGRNLYTWTDYSGYSPDVNTNGSGSNISLGTEFYTYPPARTFTLGIKANW
jgi:TonB-linked SusC/RagA family outer membrane protein